MMQSAQDRSSSSAALSAIFLLRTRTIGTQVPTLASTLTSRTQPLLRDFGFFPSSTSTGSYTHIPVFTSLRECVRQRRLQALQRNQETQTPLSLHHEQGQQLNLASEWGTPPQYSEEPQSPIAPPPEYAPSSSREATSRRDRPDADFTYTTFDVQFAMAAPATIRYLYRIFYSIFLVILLYMAIYAGVKINTAINRVGESFGLLLRAGRRLSDAGSYIYQSIVSLRHPFE